MPESVQSCFELSIHLSVKRTSRELRKYFEFDAYVSNPAQCRSVSQCVRQNYRDSTTASFHHVYTLEGRGGGGGGGWIIPTETLNLDTLISQICANAMKPNDLGSRTPNYRPFSKIASSSASVSSLVAFGRFSFLWRTRFFRLVDCKQSLNFWSVVMVCS